MVIIIKIPTLGIVARFKSPVVCKGCTHTKTQYTGIAVTMTAHNMCGLGVRMMLTTERGMG